MRSCVVQSTKIFTKKRKIIRFWSQHEMLVNFKKRNTQTAEPPYIKKKVDGNFPKNAVVLPLKN